jgi:hypothetical protein
MGGGGLSASSSYLVFPTRFADATRTDSYMIALQVVALFGLRLGRLMAMLIGSSFIVFT